MTYKVNFRDVEFSLFDYLQIQDLGKSTKFTGFRKEDFQAVLREIHKFTQNEIDPLNKTSDQIGCRFENGRVLTPPGLKEAYRHFADNGFLTMDVPSTYGGSGLPFVVAAAAGEFVTGACASFAMYTGLSRGVAHLIEVFGGENLIRKFVAKMYHGQWAGTMCLTEPQAGSAVGDIITSAVREGDHFKIKGSKIFISSGDHDLTENIIHLVLARVEGDPQGTKGISLFAVPKIRVREDGSLVEPNDVLTVNIEHKMGIRASSTCTLSFGDNDQCIGYLIGEQKRGMAMMFYLMNKARLVVGILGQSVAGAAYENALDYAKQRKQFGNTLIVEYPDVRRMLITQKAYVEGMRALLHYCAFLQDLINTSEDEKSQTRLQDRLDLLVPVCKAYCSDMGFKVTELALQTYGGYGYISEYPAEQYLRDIKIASIYEGTNGIQALDLIGRKLAKDNGRLFRELYEDLNAFYSDHSSDTAFKREMAEFKKALDQLGQVTLKFGEWAMAHKLTLPQLHAVYYLYNMGDVLLAWLLLDHSILALKKLEALWKEQGAEVEETKSKLCEENPEARFLEGKVKTGRYFVNNLLPQVEGRTKAILSGDESAMKIRF